MDDRFFPVRIDANSETAEIDWRTDYESLSYRIIEIPEYVRSGVTRLLDALHLRFGALDFSVTPDGEWYFLEINPNGQWAWIEDTTGVPIASAVADALTGRMHP